MSSGPWLHRLSELAVREKLLRTMQYTALAAGPLVLPTTRDRLDKLSSDIGLSRLVFRLMDDVPMLQHTVTSYNCTSTKSSMYPCWLLGTLGNVCDCLYYPVEHTAWCLQTGARANYLWTLATRLWVASLSLTILRCLVTLQYLHRTGDSSDLVKKTQRRQQILTIVMSGVDLMNGIAFMTSCSPNKTRIGVLGLVSSLLGLYRLWRAGDPAQC